MKFNYFGKTKVALAVVMIIITLVYAFSMTGSFIKYEETDYETDAEGNVKMVNDEPVKIVNKIDESQLGFLWFPTAHEDKLDEEMTAYFETNSSGDFEYDVNDIAPLMVLLFILAIVVAVLAVISFFIKGKVVWTAFAAIWGVLAVYCYLTNPIVEVAGNIPSMIETAGLMTMQSILAYAGCVVGVAALVISVYAKKKNEKKLLESILKRD